MNVAQWTRGVLETFADEWFTNVQLHKEVESRSGETINLLTLNRAVSRMVESGVVESRLDDTQPGPGRGWQRKEYRWV